MRPSTYAVGVTTNPGVSQVTIGGFISGGTDQIGLVAARYYGEDGSAAAFRIYVGTDSPAGTAVTPSQYNSRSPGPSNISLLFKWELGPPAALVIVGALDFTNFSWIPGPYSGGLNTNFDAGWITGTSGAAASYTLSVSSSQSATSSTIRGRRTTRKGFFWQQGNNTHLHAKTGGGAFSQICPHFTNDITWIEPSASQNGMVQSDFWNINLFGTPPPKFSIGLLQGV